LDPLADLDVDESNLLLAPSIFADDALVLSSPFPVWEEDISRFKTSVAVPLFNPLSKEETTEGLSGSLITGSAVAVLTCGST
jgi:hypothetical protein